MELLYEGKAKRIYRTEHEGEFLVSYKDSATAFNGEKKTEITGKGRLNNEISVLIFEKLKEAGVANHLIRKVSETEQLVEEVTIIPLEVVVRNTVAGSMAKRLGIEEGTPIPEPIVEFYYKDDALGDPLITESHIKLLNAATPEQTEELKTKALKVNEVLIPYFAERNVRLIDFKLEFGLRKDGTVLLADEISPDTCRLWDKETNEKFDKDVFRRDLGSLTEAYEEILKRLGGPAHV
ncbi:phosphoribosylaminoimidazolesuccinocarboxamide synthase [Bacillus sp. FJAT-42376]|uniref:phosphoribosylaminoimidazolesuccinocarboxamide synthase n=1 Tax=Bacillus sp. FJAT-42376 TaxID=2014076 RepID=UPI000F4FB37E|nr:phosphoribosylaminoimidazolesuccinocarboxamide synthase [Bacillus sp. FJAT-42376]AZB41462.1 phosphoribosylaminoimidazolesuccinocarboxamide synthase [Bacillus sp. FJAT-42376]